MSAKKVISALKERFQEMGFEDLSEDKDLNDRIYNLMYELAKANSATKTDNPLIDKGVVTNKIKSSDLSTHIDINKYPIGEDDKVLVDSQITKLLTLLESAFQIIEDQDSKTLHKISKLTKDEKTKRIYIEILGINEVINKLKLFIEKSQESKTNINKDIKEIYSKIRENIWNLSNKHNVKLNSNEIETVIQKTQQEIMNGIKKLDPNDINHNEEDFKNLIFFITENNEERFPWKDRANINNFENIPQQRDKNIQTLNILELIDDIEKKYQTEEMKVERIIDKIKKSESKLSFKDIIEQDEAIKRKDLTIISVEKTLSTVQKWKNIINKKYEKKQGQPSFKL